MQSTQAEVGDIINGLPQGRHHQLLSRAIVLNRDNTTLGCHTLNFESFAQFARALQPTEEHAPMAQIKKFKVPSSFLTLVTHTLSDRLKTNKAPGRDFIGLEILSLAPSISARAAMGILSAVGRLAYMPTILRRGTLSPIYKQQGYPSVPTNHRTICLISSLGNLCQGN